jgi:hypothetical protein
LGRTPDVMHVMLIKDNFRLCDPPRFLRLLMSLY